MGFLTFLLYLAIALGLLFMSMLLGGRAPWYFAWILGTVMAIVIAIASGVLFEAQEEREQQEKGTR
jgi:cyd operon protein YbgT